VSVAESKGDYKVRRLGLVKFQGARSVVTPLPEVHDFGLSICVDVSFMALFTFRFVSPAGRRASHPRVFNLRSFMPRRLHSDVRCLHTPSRDDGPLRGTPSASRRHAVCRPDILPVRTSTVADKWNCLGRLLFPHCTVIAQPSGAWRKGDSDDTLTRNLGAVVLATAWLLSVPQGTLFQANAQAQSPSPPEL
jgi:hypothetical protein